MHSCVSWSNRANRGLLQRPNFTGVEGAILPGNKCDDFVGLESRKTTTLAAQRVISLVSVGCVCVCANSRHKADSCSTALYSFRGKALAQSPFVNRHTNPTAPSTTVPGAAEETLRV
jgi:hypothetical protein